MRWKDLQPARLALERAFKTPLDAIWGKAETLGDVYAYLHDDLRMQVHQGELLEAHVMTVLRSQLVRRRRASPEGITRDTPIQRVFPWHRRARMWHRISRASGLKFPELDPVPGALIYVLTALFGVFLPPMAVFFSVYQMLGISELPGILITVALLVVGVTLAVLLWLALTARLPATCIDMGDLATEIAVLNRKKLRRTFFAYEPGFADPAVTVPSEGVDVFKVTERELLKWARREYPHLAQEVDEESPAALVLPSFRRRRAWRKLKGARKWDLPDLVRSPEWIYLGAILYAILIAVFVVFSDAPFPEGLAALIIPTAFFWYMGALVTKPFASALPKGCETMEGVAYNAAVFNYGRLARSEEVVRPDDAWQVFVAAVSGYAGIPPQEVEPEAELSP
jgi:hypothetical protein